MNRCRVSFNCCCCCCEGRRRASFGVSRDTATTSSSQARMMTAVLLMLFVTANAPQLAGALSFILLSSSLSYDVAPVCVCHRLVRLLVVVSSEYLPKFRQNLFSSSAKEMPILVWNIRTTGHNVTIAFSVLLGRLCWWL